MHKGFKHHFALVGFILLGLGVETFAESPRFLKSSWQGRQDEYPNVTIQWKSRFIYRGQAKETDPFDIARANTTEKLFDVVSHEKGKFILSGNNTFIRHFYSGAKGQAPIPTEYNWIDGDFKQKLSHYGYGYLGTSRSPSHTYNLFSSLAFIYRPLNSDRFSMIKSLKCHTSKPDFPWGGREVISLVANTPAGTKEIFFDRHFGGHYLGTRSKDHSGEEFTIEIFPKSTGKFEIEKVVETLTDSSNRLHHKHTFYDFETDYSNKLIESEMDIEFDEGMQVRIKGDDGKMQRFIFTKGRMELETETNRHKYNSRVWQPSKS